VRDLKDESSRGIERAQVSIDNFNRMFEGEGGYLVRHGLCEQGDRQRMKEHCRCPRRYTYPLYSRGSVFSLCLS